MAIPGTTPDLPVVAKVRIGEKKKSSGGKEYPTSVDHFLCDDAAFNAAFSKPKVLRVTFPFQRGDQNFTTGLEYWRGKQLTCYSKGEGTPPLAYRVKDMVKDWDVVRGDEMGRERMPVTCQVRACPFLMDKACKPMGRLQFFIAGLDRTRGVYQIDTKSWNTIEKIEPFLSLIDDCREQEFLLHVEIVQKGRDKYPVIRLEAAVQVNSPHDAALADALVELHKQLAPGLPVEPLRKALAATLDIANPGWRDNGAMIEWVKTNGVTVAAEKLLKRYEL